MSNLRQAAQDVLELVEWIKDRLDVVREGGDIRISPILIDNLRAALAEPEQEPVAWMESPHGAIRANPLYKHTFSSQLLHWQIPLYTTPPQRKPLTDEEISNI